MAKRAETTRRGKSAPARKKAAAPAAAKQPERASSREEDASRSASPGNLPRGIWRGQLRLALVNVAVELYPAVQPGARIAFHLVDRKTGKRIHYDKVVAEDGSVANDRIARAIEISRGNYVVLENAEIEALKRVERHVIDLVQFVEACEIDPIWFDRPYYLAPANQAADEGYGILREAMRKTKRIGLGQFTMRGRDYIGALKPCGRGLLLETLRFSDEVRNAAPFFTEIPEEKPDPELLDLATELIGRKSGPFDPERFVDRYTKDLRALIEEKVRTHKPVHVEEERPREGAQVINLMDALRRSVERGGGSRGVAA